jgi:predicted tellurium resistance membrane protein TerC
MRKPKTFREAVVLIVLADVAMSLDNVLGVAGAAREHLWVMVIGLALSVFLMAVSSTYIANLLTKHRWLIYLGLVVILHVALSMIWDGGMEVWLVSKHYFV